MGGAEGRWEGDREKQGQVEKPEVLVSFDLGSFHYALCPLTGFLEPPPPTPGTKSSEVATSEN